jgi:hypothetical protein
VHVCYRFTVKLREHSDALSECVDPVLAALRDAERSAGPSFAARNADLS